MIRGQRALDMPENHMEMMEIIAWGTGIISRSFPRVSLGCWASGMVAQGVAMRGW